MLVSQQEVLEPLNKRVSLLESELRAAKRRETKLAATHFRLRQDIASSGGDLKCANATG
jgi:chaperonin cofactor prefoldin